MLFRIQKGRKKRPVFAVSLLACAAFIALFVWGWGLPLSDVGRFFLMISGGILILVLLAAFCAALLVWLKKLFRNRE